jgi:hypothetical protein
MRNRFVVGPAAAVSCLFVSLAFAGRDAVAETFRQIIAKRPAPVLEGFADRASPEQKGAMATESFWDLLKLREEPAAAAVPELGEILAAHEGSTRIHRFAAAQALFAAGTEDAKRTLEKYLLAPEYPADMAIGYSSHWQMAEPERSRFIETYLLRDLSRDLAVRVETRWSDAGANNAGAGKNVMQEKKLLVTVKLINESDRVLAIPGDQHYRTRCLQFRGPSGTFAPQMQMGVHGPIASRWQRLKPGQSMSFDVALQMKVDTTSLATARRNATDPATIHALLSSTDTGFVLSEFGTYKLSAMIVRTPLAEEQKKSLRERDGIEAGEVWMGRAVSKPVDVELRATARQE